MAQFRVMTWNVENLFDVGDDDGPKTQAQFAAKIESLRAVITRSGRRPGATRLIIARGVGASERGRVRAIEKKYTSSRDTTVRVLSDAR